MIDYLLTRLFVDAQLDFAISSLPQFADQIKSVKRVRTKSQFNILVCHVVEISVIRRKCGK